MKGHEVGAAVDTSACASLRPAPHFGPRFRPLNVPENCFQAFAPNLLGMSNINDPRNGLLWCDFIGALCWGCILLILVPWGLGSAATQGRGVTTHSMLSRNMR